MAGTTSRDNSAKPKSDSYSADQIKVLKASMPFANDLPCTSAARGRRVVPTVDESGRQQCRRTYGRLRGSH